jgi:hypothetical protein
VQTTVEVHRRNVGQARGNASTPAKPPCEYFNEADFEAKYFNEANFEAKYFYEANFEAEYFNEADSEAKYFNEAEIEAKTILKSFQF